MKPSNLAERLEDFAASIVAADAPKEKSPRMAAAETAAHRAAAPRRLSLDSRRIVIRDTGLRHFRR